MYYLGMRPRNLRLILLLSSLVFCCSDLLSAPDDSRVLVTGEGFTLERSEIEKGAAGKLKELHLERLRAPARIEKRRHEILTETMEDLTSEKLLRMESKKRGITTERLTELEITPRVKPLTEEELDKLFTLNKNQLRGTREEMLAQITAYVRKQREKEAHSEYTKKLAEEYGVEYRMPPIRFKVPAAGHPAFGPKDAPVTIVEFSDFECSHCANAGAELHKVYLEFEGKIRIVFRQYPLRVIHEKAWKAAEASLCAAEQEKFWEMHNLLFSGQDKLDPEGLKEKAGQLGLDQDSFDKCLDSGRYSDAVDLDLVEGSRAGVSGTPSIFVNGRPLEERVSYESIRQMVLEELILDDTPE